MTTYRFKHKGSSVVRDSLMAIGRMFTKGATRAVKKAAEKRGEAAAKKVAAKAAEKASNKIKQMLQARGGQKGSAKIQKILRVRRKATPRKANPQSDAMLKLSRILANQL